MDKNKVQRRGILMAFIAWLASTGCGLPEQIHCDGYAVSGDFTPDEVDRIQRAVKRDNDFIGHEAIVLKTGGYPGACGINRLNSQAEYDEFHASESAANASSDHFVALFVPRNGAVWVYPDRLTSIDRFENVIMHEMLHAVGIPIHDADGIMSHNAGASDFSKDDMELCRSYGVCK